MLVLQLGLMRLMYARFNASFSLGFGNGLGSSLSLAGWAGTARAPGPPGRRRIIIIIKLPGSEWR